MRGRPKKEEARQDACRVRLNEKERMTLEALCELTGLNESECIRRSISVWYQIKKNTPH